jgi:hypothetical protein
MRAFSPLAAEMPIAGPRGGGKRRIPATLEYPAREAIVFQKVSRL